jgi:radical SAM superfamily enzyme YgiQ (UPF0313 family)
MKILLILANTKTQLEPSLSIGYLASYLKKYSKLTLEIKLLDHLPNDISKVKKYSPDLIGISSLSFQYKNAVDFAVKIKEALNVPLLIGGLHISISPSSFDPVFDAAIIGEGEQTLLEFVEHFDKFGKSVKGLEKIDGLLYINEENKPVVTKKREPLKPLDIVPYPARELYNMNVILNDKKNVFGQCFGKGTYMFTSRGCPFKCSFCSSSRFWDSVRFHSADYVVEEINELINSYGVKFIRIFDDLFSFNKKRMREIVKKVEEYKINKKVQFGMFTRADLFDDETASLLKRMNTSFIDFGMESGVQRILDILKQGRVKVEHLRRAVKLCRKYDISVGGSFVLGTPGETKQDMLDTLEFIKELKLDKLYVYPLMPFVGTEMWEYAKKENLIDDECAIDNIMAIRGALTVEDIPDKLLLINKDITPEDFVEVFNLIQKERESKYDYNWEDLIPPEDDDYDL